MAELLSLPREIRKEIYALCFSITERRQLVTPDVKRIRRTTSNCDTSHTINGHVAILRVCRQLHEEALEGLYSSVTFYFNNHPHETPKAQEDRRHQQILSGRHEFLGAQESNTDFADMKPWLETIGIHARGLIRAMHLDFTMGELSKPSERERELNFGI